MEDVILRFGTFEGETLPVPFPCGKDAKVERPPRTRALKISTLLINASAGNTLGFRMQPVLAEGNDEQRRNRRRLPGNGLIGV